METTTLTETIREIMDAPTSPRWIGIRRDTYRPEIGATLRPSTKWDAEGEGAMDYLAGTSAMIIEEPSDIESALRLLESRYRGLGDTLTILGCAARPLDGEDSGERLFPEAVCLATISL